MACEQAEVGIDSTDPSCEETGPTVTQVCAQSDMRPASEPECNVSSEVECRTISYETVCSGTQEALCAFDFLPCNVAPPALSEVCAAEGLVPATEEECASVECNEVMYPSGCGQTGRTLCKASDLLCTEEPPALSEVCAAEGLVPATEEECASVECNEVMYPSACGQTGRTLCKAADQPCTEEGYPDPQSFCEDNGLVIATEEECEEMTCQTIEFAIACGNTAEVLCTQPTPQDPLPANCAERSEDQCSQDQTCQWLVPEPWACADPEEILPEAGCFPIMGCTDDSECGMGESCLPVAFGECDQPGDVCEACASYLNLCLPQVTQD